MDDKTSDAIWQASYFICKKRYFEARVTLTGINHPVAHDWIKLLDERLASTILRATHLLPARVSKAV